MTARTSARGSAGQRAVEAVIVGAALAVTAAGRLVDAGRSAAETASAVVSLWRRR